LATSFDERADDAVELVVHGAILIDVAREVESETSGSARTARAAPADPLHATARPPSQRSVESSAATKVLRGGPRPRIHHILRAGRSRKVWRISVIA
jgi:hypothetical protein